VKLTRLRVEISMTRKLFGSDAGEICKAHPQLDRNACSWNRSDVARCVKQRIAVPNPAI
jgi:benzoyl-CoA reductase/2-hydroxyglutaryl-CoA dehydratase subunit BcrC/BadD/HgdB